MDPDVVGVFTSWKKRKRTEKRKKNNLLKTKLMLNIIMSVEGTQLLHLWLARGVPSPVSYATGNNQLTAENIWISPRRQLVFFF